MSAFGGKQTSARVASMTAFEVKPGIIRTAGSVVLSLHHSDDLKKSPRFGRAKFFRNYDRSGLYHVLADRTAASGPSCKYTALSMARACSAIF